MHRYFIVHKPYGYLSQFSGTDNELTLQHLVQQNEVKNFPKDIYPIGRLDKDSEGILLLTNDNVLKTRLLDPKQKHYKTYWAQLEGSPTAESLQPILNGGIQIKHEGKHYNCLPAKARLLGPVAIADRNPPIRYRAAIPTTWVEIQLHEGKNRQVRQMTAALGFPTLRLIRTAIQRLQWDKYPGGSITEISRTELFQQLEIRS
jgi:23S rRNA pseudouridine2457 synthase